MRKLSWWVLGAMALTAPLAHADEGMWTFNQFPAAKVESAYGFKPDEAWLQRLQLASVRIAGGCSASLVSPQGLVMTNHHCARECIQNISGLRKKDFNRDGFIARRPSEEPRCPGMEMNQLTDISDVTQTVRDATKTTPPEQFNEVQKAVIADIEKTCATGDEWRCEVVTLFRGGAYNLYKYRRLQDIRLVFAPEDQIAFFGGDPDNFNFPRYDLDVTFLRIYGADGKPWATETYLPFSKTGVKEGELTFVSGNPGGTSRGMTMAQFQDARDMDLPKALMQLSQMRGWMTEYQQRGKEQLRHSNDDLFGVENSFKALKGQHEALANQLFWMNLQKSEADFRRKVVTTPALFAQYCDVCDRISA
ncbi:MAG: serine protease, partial [Burkholderiales bacterium PBB4]